MLEKSPPGRVARERCEAGPMLLTAKLREIRESHDAGTDGLESREVTVDAPSYDEAMALVVEQTPAGWQRLWVRTG